MSTLQDAQSKSTTKAFVSALVSSSAALAIQVVAFTYLKSRLLRVYSPRSFLPPPDKRAALVPKGPWRWLVALFTNPSEDIIQKNGLDAYLCIRFLRVAVTIFAVFTFLTWAVLLPTDTVGINSGFKGLEQLSWGNVPTNQQTRYAAHLVVVYLLTFFVLWIIRRELDHAVRCRHQFLISHSHAKTAQAKTVLITGLPDTIQTEKDLRFLLSFIPGGIKKIWIYRDNGILPDLFDERLDACKKLENAECELLRDALKAKLVEDKAKKRAEKQAKRVEKKNAKIDSADKTAVELQVIEQGVEKKRDEAFGKVVRPTHRLGWWKIPFLGPKVDTITWCKDEIVRLTKEIEVLRKDSGKNPSHGSAFVQCNMQMGAHVLAQTVIHNQPLAMYDKWTDVAPEDICWRNIDDGVYEQRARYITSWLATLGLIVAWSFPVAFVTLWSNVDSLCTKVSVFRWVCELPDIPQGIIQGVLPPLLYAILFVILPFILKGLAWYEDIPRYSLMSLSVYKRYFFFLIVHGFFVATLSSGLTSAIPAAINNPTSIVEEISRNMPNASIFFLTYVVTTGFAGAAAALLQLVPLLVYFINRWLFGDTPRTAYKKTFQMPTADFGEILPRMSLIATIGFAYSIISPVINGLAMLSFGLLWMSWKFLFTYVFDQPAHLETGGLYFIMAMWNLFSGLYIEQVCLAVLFLLATDADGHRSSIPQAAMMVLLFCITLCTHILFKRTYEPITKFLPVSLATEKLAKKYDQSHPGQLSKNLLPDLFHRDVRKTVRRRLKIPSTSAVPTVQDTMGKLLKSEAKMNAEKDKRIQENEFDVGILAGVLQTDIKGKDVPPGEDTVGASSAFNRNKAETLVESHLEDDAARPSTSMETAETAVKFPESPDGLKRGKSAGSQKSIRSKKSFNGDKLDGFAPAAGPVQIRDLEVGGPDEGNGGDSSDDDDIDDHAFQHPSTYVNAPYIWIPRDDLGLSKYLIEELARDGVVASDEGAFIDAHGNVDVVRNPPDEEWEGGHDF